MSARILAVVPARGGSKGLPRKALQPLAGLPLIAHTLELARRCPSLERVIVSTDSEEIADVARSHGGDVPFIRPADLAADDTPMWPVVRHALAVAGDGFDAVLLLQPTSPLRLPEDVEAALSTLASSEDVAGVIGVSKPRHNPIWSAMSVREGVLTPLFEDAYRYTRRQALPHVVDVDGSLYLWRADFVRGHDADPGGPYAALELPALRSVDIDGPDDLAVVEALLTSRVVSLPWLA